MTKGNNYPFGSTQGGRGANSVDYRFGFNGKENDGEWGTSLVQDYGFRLYNPGIGRFLSVDPLSPSYAWYTPYQFAGNKPIGAIDLDGLEEKWVIIKAHRYIDAIDYDFRGVQTRIDEASTIAYNGGRAAVTHMIIQVDDGSTITYDIIEPLNANGLVTVEKEGRTYEFEPTAKYNLNKFSAGYDWERMKENNTKEFYFFSPGHSALNHYATFDFGKGALYRGRYSVIDTISTTGGIYSVYNITVDDHHNYFVGKEGILVHSVGPCNYLKTALKRQGFETGDPYPNGLSEKFTDGVYNYEVRIHGPDINAPAGSNAASNNIYRVGRKKIPVEGQQGSGLEYMDSSGNWHHQSTLKPTYKDGTANPNYNPEAANDIHLVVPDGPINLDNTGG